MIKKLLLILITATLFFSGCSGPIVIEDKGIKECPEGMKNVNGRVCVDVFEFPNQEGEYPLVNVDWETASALCDSRGKRLCTGDEWIFACGSGEGKSMPGEDGAKTPCNTSQKYMIPDISSADSEGKEKKFEISDEEFLSDVKVERAGIFTISTETASEEIVDLVQAIHLYLEIHERILSAKDIIYDLSEKGITFRKRGVQDDYLETFLEKSHFIAPHIAEIKADVMKINAATTAEVTDTKKLLGTYKKNLEETWKTKNDVGRLFFRKNDKKETTDKFNRLSELAVEQRKIITELFAANPDTVLDMAKLNLEESEKQLDEFINKIYDEIIPELSHNDIALMKDEVNPYFIQNDMERFPLYFYAVQRKLKLEYSSEDKQFTLNKPDLEAGANSNCVTDQGVYDMVGNVWEWTGDDKSSATYRGGDSNEGSGVHFKKCNPSLKGVNLKPPEHKSPFIGFRCCVVPDEKTAVEEKTE